MAKVNKKVNPTPEKGILIQNIDIRPVVRQSQDINTWRNALKSAEAINGTRTALYDLYSEILLDGTLKSLIAKRVLGVTKTSLQFVDKNNEPVEAITQLLKTKQFRTLRKEIQLSKAWGISVIELGVENNKLKVYSVPRKHIKPNEGIITNNQYDTSGIDYRNPPLSKYVFEIGKWDDLGYILEASQYVIYKRGGFGDWAHFAEIFGMPFREARYDGFNKEVRAQLEIALQDAGSAGYAILPREAELTFHESKSTQGSSELYNMLRNACNQELSVLVLGQTETTTKTAGKLGGNDDTHEQTEDDINHDDKLDELSILNEQVVPILKNLGYPADGEFIHEKIDEKLSVKDMVDVVTKVKNEIKAPVDDDFVYQLTGIPKPANYNKIKAQQEADKKVQQNNFQQPNNNKEQKAKLFIENDEPTFLNFWERLKINLSDFFDQAPKG